LPPIASKKVLTRGAKTLLQVFKLSTGSGIALAGEEEHPAYSPQVLLDMGSTLEDLPVPPEAPGLPDLVLQASEEIPVVARELLSLHA
jgi:hypothetical protein